LPIVLTIANQKGGCGKTTTIMNLAGGLTAARYRVLVVDADPQASATLWSIAQGQNGLSFEVRPSRYFKRYVQIQQFDCDIVLVDTPPGIADSLDASSQFARDAIGGANAILIPLRPSVLDFRAASTFIRYLARVKAPRTPAAVLLNGIDRTVTSRDAPDAAAHLISPLANGTVLQSTIGRRAAITEVSGSGKTIFDYRPRHAATLEYANLTKEIIQWLKPAARP
jgi:chromosome partitioning protein